MQSPIYDQSGGIGKEYGFVKTTKPKKAGFTSTRGVYLGWSGDSSLTSPFFFEGLKNTKVAINVPFLKF